MSIKFTRASSQYLSAPDHASFTYPDSDWALAFVMSFDGVTTGTNPQYVVSNGAFLAAGSLNVVYHTADETGGGIVSNRFTVYAGTSGTEALISTNATTSGSWLFVLQRSGTTLTLRRCPILNAAPSTGAAVVADGSATFSGAYNGPSGMYIGARADLTAARMCDQSVARVFRIDSTLTDLEVARLAYGEPISALGKTPVWGVRMDTPTDLADLGASANVFTATNSPAAGTAPGFGYGGAALAAPAIAGTPAIVGTPAAGAATGFTPASVTGNPTPTRTYQWRIDGVDVSGATAATYTPISGDAGKTLSVRQIETNSQGTANATSAGVAVATALSAPVITGTPAVIGTPAVGSASSFTPASVTGNPAPTRTYQWRLDGVDVSGATASTYTPVAGDAGKALSVRQIETNSQGNTGATSAGVTVTTVAGTVDVAQITAERIFQRIGTAAAIPMSGTYTGAAPATIEYQLYAADGSTVSRAWAALTGATISGGTWSATPSVTQGGMFRLAVRAKDGGGTVLATSNVKANLFGVGDLIACIGSSSAEKWFQFYSGTGFTPAANVRRHQSGTWSTMTTDGCATQMANSFASQAGVPVGMLGYGIGGDTLANWLVTTNSAWTTFAAAVAAVGGKLAGVISSMGSNDAANGIVTSRASHLANLRQLATNLRSITSQPTLPLLISGFNSRPTVPAALADYVRMAENDAGDDSNVYHIQTTDLELSGDQVHLTAAGFTACATRSQTVFGAVLNGGAYKRGPKMTGITYSGATATVTLAHRSGSDITPASSIAGFTVTDSGSPAINIASVVRVSPTQIAITGDRAFVSPVVKYLSGGLNPTPNTVFDNGAMPLPMHVETTLSAVATQSAVASDFSASYTIANSVAANFAASYQTYNVIAAEYAAGYLIAAQVSNDFVAAYSVLATGTVGNDLLGAYAVRALVAQSFSFAYTIAAAPAGSIDASKVPPARTVAFPGSVRVVTFPGSKREVTF